MLFIQFIIIAFALFALYRAFCRFRAGELHLPQLLLWSVVWVAVIGATLLPQSTTWFAGQIGVGRGVDAVMYLAIILLFYMIFRIFLRIEKIERDITALVRKVGIDESMREEAETSETK